MAIFRRKQPLEHHNMFSHQIFLLQTEQSVKVDDEGKFLLELRMTECNKGKKRKTDNSMEGS